MSAGAAMAGDLPQIKLSDQNSVPACVTPGRLMSYVRSRNDKLEAKFDDVATEYMRNGEELGIRWDYAFFQMMLETNTLKYTGDVKISQNNFAGLGATGRGARGESFTTVADGVRAHLQHVLMYSGEKIESPVAQRTRDIQSWGVLTKWQSTIKEPMTYTQLGKKWAPTSRGYARDIEVLAGLFFNGACKEPDPHPELVEAARKGRTSDTAEAAPAGKGAEIAKRAIAEARAEGAPRSGLGAGSVAKEAQAGISAGVTGSIAAAGAQPVKILNAAASANGATETGSRPADSAPQLARPETSKSDTAKADAAKSDPGKTDATPAAVSESKSSEIETAALSATSLQQTKPAASEAKCRVFTASYGGAKSIIIKATGEDALINYTVLDVNEGAEQREAEAYIGAYAKGGETVGEFPSQDRALEKAFELCPEG
jgi:hypothetical protein